MRYENEYTPTLHFNDRAFVEFRNDWLQLPWFTKAGTHWNWIDISVALIEFHVERDNMFAGWDVDIRLLGLGLRLRWNTEPNEKTLEILDRVKEYDERQKPTALPCPHGRQPFGGEPGWKSCPHCLGINS